MSEHTPGPWEVHCPDDLFPHVNIGPDSGIGYESIIVNGCNPGGPIELHRANARLIAAAPDMLEAIVAWRDEYLIPKYGNSVWKCPFVVGIMEAARKAEGK